MRECYRRLCRVDISELLTKLPAVNFVDTGGPNGWLAAPKPDWLVPFIKTLTNEPFTFPMIRKLPAYQGLPPHKDHWGNLPNVGRRMHVPLVSHPDVVMCWPDDGVEVHLEPGWLWEVNFLKLHAVRHMAPVDRVHLHFNVVER